MKNLRNLFLSILILSGILMLWGGEGKRVAVVSLLIVITSIIISYRKEQGKRKLEQQLKDEQLRVMEIRTQLFIERSTREKIETDKQNQTVDYYRRLNEIAIPMLLRIRNEPTLHFTEKDWEIMARNTDACFNGFTGRLRKQYPQLTQEDIRFCYLIKMELPIPVLAQIYHIAGGSVSRKKMRLKEKMEIENKSLDEFIKQF